MAQSRSKALAQSFQVVSRTEYGVQIDDQRVALGIDRMCRF